MKAIDYVAVHAALSTVFTELFENTPVTVGTYYQHSDFETALDIIEVCVENPNYDCTKLLRRTEKTTLKMIKNIRKSISQINYEQFEIEVCVINGFLDCLIKKLDVINLPVADLHSQNPSLGLRIVA